MGFRWVSCDARVEYLYGVGTQPISNLFGTCDLTSLRYMLDRAMCVIMNEHEKLDCSSDNDALFVATP